MDPVPSTLAENVRDIWPPPFGPEEWERLRVLDRRCRLTFDRYDRDGNLRGPKGPPKPDRVWLCHIHLQDGMAHESVRAIQPNLRSAVLEALIEAEKRGWHRPKEHLRPAG